MNVSEASPAERLVTGRELEVSLKASFLGLDDGFKQFAVLHLGPHAPRLAIG